MCHYGITTRRFFNTYQTARQPRKARFHPQPLSQRQIDATDQEIDRLVYELYDLTDEEIAIVKGEFR